MAQQLTAHHFGYMVKDIAKSRAAFECLGFTAQSANPVFDPDRACFILFMVAGGGGMRVELIQPKDETSPVWNLAKKYANTPYHICFETPDIEAAISLLTRSEQGGKCVLFLPPARAIAISESAQVAFLMSADIGMIELAQLHKI